MAYKKVSVDPNNPNENSDVEIDVGSGYEPYFKGSIPAPSQYTDSAGTITITWFNNFGVRIKPAKPGDPAPDADVEYTVKLKKLPDGKRLFVKNKSGNIIEVTKKGPNDAQNAWLKYSDDDSDDKKVKKIKFTWNVGDPPIGGGP